jgi:hypothetical protein
MTQQRRTREYRVRRQKGKAMNRTSKAERRRAKQQQITWKKGQRGLKRTLRVAKFIILPAMPHKGTINDWVRHLRQCDADHHAYVQFRATLRVTPVTEEEAERDD